MKLLKINFLYLALVFMALTYTSCEEDVASDNELSEYVGLEERRVIEILPTETGVVETKIYSTASSVSRTVNLLVDSSTNIDLNYVSFPSSITIPAGTTEVPFEIVFENYGLGAAGKTFALKIEAQAGMNVGLPVGSVTTSNGYSSNTSKLFKITARDYCPNTSVNLSIKFDNYPEETAWELYDASFNLIASGGFDASGTTITGYAALGFADQETFSTDFCLESGDYTFVIYDDYGDGMYTSASVQGNYTVKLQDGTVLVQGGGNFGSFQDTAFTIQ
ncbi:hypothetical protein GOQ30_08845 [Flavobacterium sp. TP390]|uniref:DUF1735 domain-containing protein n=1 Tax=Flavobacterium profundi TaxID=1774945 RepID=A0A6I4ILK3_9FLAO|nr:hypothetical protein [Flavobacterium profundi]MVO09262.1 hypothetical protein [Flavobacterium profundi]